MSSFDVDVGGSYAIVYCVTIFFTLVALVASSFIPVPAALGKYLVASNGETTVATEMGSDFYLSARNSADAKTITLSFYAGGMGAWVLYTTTEMGANPQLSWIAVLGYALASAFPAVLVGIIGPKVRDLCGEKAFTAIDFACSRYGRVMQLLVSCISIFYMLIFIVAELTSISNVYALLVDKPIFNDQNMGYTTHIAIVIVIFTVFYTTVGGLPASIITDKVQAAIMIALVLILFLAVLIAPENKVTASEFGAASNWTLDGFMALITLVIAVACAELFNQSTWQRVWAAKDTQALRRGYFQACGPVFLTMLFFGVMGMIAYSKDPESYDTFTKLAYLSFFDILEPLHPFWHILVLILVTAFCTSSIDSLQVGIVGIFNKDILRISSKGSMGKWISRGLLILVNIPAVIMSTKRFDVLPLFLIADLVCATAVLPLFLGIMTEDWGILKAPTELGSVLGAISAMGAVLINGRILNVTEATNYLGEVIATGPFSYFWLTNKDICALCGPKTMTTFIVTPLVGGIFTFVFSALDVLVRGENAKKPMFGLHGGDLGDQMKAGDVSKTLETGDVEAVKAVEVLAE